MPPLNDLHLVTVFFLPSIETHCQQRGILGTHKGYIHDTPVQWRWYPHYLWMGYQKAAAIRGEDMSTSESSFEILPLPSSVTKWVCAERPDSEWQQLSRRHHVPFQVCTGSPPSAEGWQWAAKQGVTNTSRCCSHLFSCKTQGYPGSPAFSEPAWTLTSAASCLLQENWWHLAENAIHMCFDQVYANLSLCPLALAKTQNHRFSSRYWNFLWQKGIWWCPSERPFKLLPLSWALLQCQNFFSIVKIFHSLSGA